ncbi:hypothetical protein SEA_TEMPO_65 [Microbacterium phage Tempo]|nr:hypothetical protein SEA_TEMPO_65 [Microbacterium phage Tempo]QKO02815.1 hypothetical protein SEA_KELCOLE_63 [Microbacterium phage Kelcole]WNN94090.1 hypothetical protein SEA_FREGLEY_65 [Microbacterium phage Fregley]
MGTQDSNITEEQVDDAINTAYELKDEVGSKWPGMSYEDGVIAALEWIKGDREENPFEEN